ncbi:arginase [Chitinasiproducens palmae]|uniref:Arginase n=1 Tax=Chitinasiproducens palmae TaxID=1770053 RepID=A0A1H2PP95_9BURK|nr:arginase [Chitinasiproducens palmae]SDV48460.1 arginase [Chitinasiproducens palmae]
MISEREFASRTPRQLQLIAAELGEGAQRTGCKAGPRALLPLLAAALREAGHGLAPMRLIASRPAPADDKLTTVADFVPRLAAVVAQAAGAPCAASRPPASAASSASSASSCAAAPAAEAGAFPLVIGGDHSCAVGTWSGMAHAVASAHGARLPLGLVWIDAHLDSHTPATSESGAPHGMPLAALLGEGDPRLAALGGWRGKVSATHAVVVGARSFEAGEAALLARLGVRVIDAVEVAARGVSACLAEARGIARAAPGGYGISLDLDAFDPLDAPGVGSPAPGGLPVRATIDALAGLYRDVRLRGFELVEYNPALDVDDRTARLASALIASVFGRMSRSTRGPGAAGARAAVGLGA